MLPNARSNRPPRLRLLRQLRKRPLLPISIGCTRTDELCTEPGCARCFRYGSSPVAACVAHRLLHATVGPAFQRLQRPHPSHLEPSPVSSLNWAGRPVPLVLLYRRKRKSIRKSQTNKQSREWVHRPFQRTSRRHPLHRRHLLAKRALLLLHASWHP